MDQSEKMIVNRDIRLADIARINVEVKGRRDYPLAYRNIATSLERRFDIALLRWRRGESPMLDLERALAISSEMSMAIADWQLHDGTLSDYGYIWNVVHYISFLLDQPVALPQDRLSHIRNDQMQYADVALDYSILDALEGRDWRTGLPEAFNYLASKKRQALAVETYRTYFDLLDADGDNELATALVRTAEANYNKRSRDGFYGGGPTFMGGGPDNPYVVDFVLAAILKKIKWVGESIHLWRWSVS